MTFSQKIFKQSYTTTHTIKYNLAVMEYERVEDKEERRDHVRHKRRYGPKLHGKRLAELVRNALLKRIRKSYE